MWRATLEEMPIAFFSHPSSASKMALPGALGAIRFTRWIDIQHDPGNFPPVRALSVGIEQAQICDGMSLVIPGQDLVRWCEVGNGRVWRLRLHVQVHWGGLR